MTDISSHPTRKSWFRVPRSAFRVQCALSLVIALMVGCRSDGLWSGAENGRVEELHLLGTPVALNLDKKPGADGLGLRVYASNARMPGAVRIGSGTLTILLFDGGLHAQDTLSATPM